MKNFIDRLFLSKYQNQSDQIQHQARSMTVLAVGIVLICSLLFFLLSEQMLKILDLGIILFFTVFLILVKLGFQRMVGLLMVISLNLLLGVVGMVEAYEDEMVIYFMGFLQIFVTFLTLLVTTGGLHAWISGGLGFLFVWLYRTFVAVPNQHADAIPLLTDYVLISLLILFAAYIVSISNKRGRELLAQSREEAMSNEEKAEKLVSLVQTLSSDFNTGDTLKTSVGHMSRNLNEINHSIMEIKEEILELKQGSEAARDASQSISESSSVLSAETETQSSLIEESSAAVIEMASSIDNITRIAGERKQAIESLKSRSEEANRAVGESVQSMEMLLQLVSSLEEINKVISGISAQTSLLAMNAAIEAAHAGDAGKGFAVVADEVRKLSENSSENVKIIAETLKKITNSINSSSELNRNVSKTFQEIQGEIGLVAQGMNEIVQGINELSAGTREINEGTAQSVSSTGQVKQGVNNVNGKIQEIRKQLERQDLVVASIARSVEETSGELSKIKEESSLIQKIGDQNVKNLHSLEERIKAI